MKRGVALAALVAFFATTANHALACSTTPVFEDGGRYVGGSLSQQIAREAYTIQLVRARRGRVIGRAPERTFEAEPGEPFYSFNLEVVETLADRTWPLLQTLGWSSARSRLFVNAYDRQPTVSTADGYRTMDRVEVWLNPEALDHPGSAEGYYALRAPIPARVSDSSCGWAMGIDDGELFVALRDQRGRLYAFDYLGAGAAGQLPIRYTFSPSRRTVQTAGAPPLIRVTGRNDPFYRRLRAALRANNRLVQ